MVLATRNFSVGLLASGEAKVTFPYDPDMVMLIKTVPGKRWEPEAKFWAIPLVGLRNFIRQAGRAGMHVELSEGVEQALNLGNERRKALEVAKGDESPLALPTNTTPYLFQNAGIRYLKYALHSFHATLLGDDPGLGKL